MVKTEMAVRTMQNAGMSGLGSAGRHLMAEESMHPRWEETDLAAIAVDPAGCV